MSPLCVIPDAVVAKRFVNPKVFAGKTVAADKIVSLQIRLPRGQVPKSVLDDAQSAARAPADRC